MTALYITESMRANRTRKVAKRHLGGIPLSSARIDQLVCAQDDLISDIPAQSRNGGATTV